MIEVIGARKNTIVRIPSFEIEDREQKKTILLAAKHRLLEASGVYEQRRLADEAALNAKRTATIIGRAKHIGWVGGYFAGVVPAAYLASEAVRLVPQEFEGLRALAGFGSVISVEALTTTAGYFIGRALGRRLALRPAR